MAMSFAVCGFCGLLMDARGENGHANACARPPVCVCSVPSPDAIGECSKCERPFKPGHPGLMAARARWTARLVDAGVDVDS